MELKLDTTRGYLVEKFAKAAIAFANSKLTFADKANAPETQGQYYLKENVIILYLSAKDKTSTFIHEVAHAVHYKIRPQDFKNTIKSKAITEGVAIKIASLIAKNFNTWYYAKCECEKYQKEIDEITSIIFDVLNIFDISFSKAKIINNNPFIVYSTTFYTNLVISVIVVDIAAVIVAIVILFVLGKTLNYP